MNHKYPQTTWAYRIAPILASLLPENSKVLDAPSGNGTFSYWLRKKSKKNFEYLLLDIDQKSIDTAQANKFDAQTFDFSKDNFVFGKQKAWLFINSLYCLDCSDITMKMMQSNCKYIFAVFPDTESSTYKSFSIYNPNFKNPKAMTIDETTKYVEAFGFKMTKKKGISFFNFHKMNHLIGKLSFRSNFTYCMYNIFDNAYKIIGHKPNYYFVLFENTANY